MKTPQYIFRTYLFFLILLVAFSHVAVAQKSTSVKPDKTAVTANMIEARQFVFKAQSARPARGQLIQLNPEYDLRISADTITSDLPFFGRAYSAPINGRGGIEFDSKDFSYVQKDRKKGGWDISIKPKDAFDVRQIFLTVFENGSASLLVLSNNRENISFNGYITGK